MKKIKFISIVISIFVVLYICTSWLLLDGKIIYTTSFNESSIDASKKENLFISADLNVTAEGDSIINWINIINVWSNKRYEIRYFGILFHWTYTRPEWRYLNIDFKNELYPALNGWCVNDANGGYTRCCNRVSCNVGDTIKIDFYKCKDELKLGKLKIVVK